MNGEQDIAAAITTEFGLALQPGASADELLKSLAAHINDLIKNNFERLVSLLYRIDVNETKLRQLLQQQPDKDAGLIIAALIIERQVQKIKTRRMFNQRDNDMDAEEKW